MTIVIKTIPGILFFLGCIGLINTVAAQDTSYTRRELPDFRNPRLSLEQRVNDLVSLLTLEEKVLQMQNDAPSIPRLGLPAYNWWSECLHGVARNSVATVFPQAIGMAATWDTDLIRDEADVISTEARAKYKEAIEKGQRGRYQGLTFWSPNINIFRDPRWGRGQETFGEDPYLTGCIGVAFVKGLQGNDTRYFKVIATAKHFAVHSGPESLRHKFDAWCSEHDLYETYLPAFEALVKDGNVYSVMGAYNRFRGTPCCASDPLLDETLRIKWGFKGYVVSDCGAIWDIYNGHGVVPTAEQAAVLGVMAGCDLTCGNEYRELTGAVTKGYIGEQVIDASVRRLFTARFRLGLFDPDSLVPWSGIPVSDNDLESSRKLARKVAQESIVLLKNKDHLLPLSDGIKEIAVIGPYADKINVLLGNYHGIPSRPVTVLTGIKNHAGKRMHISYSPGVPALEDQNKFNPSDTVDLYKMARKADVIIFVGGISPGLEGEEMDVIVEGFSGGDRTSLDLPGNQQKLLEELKKTGKPVILVLVNGSALAVKWAEEAIPAIVEAWYPGEEGGNAVADVLFGEYNPAGRLPVTFYQSVNDLPPFTDYSMKNRTYRYFTGKTLYPFGFGLSYSEFKYESVYSDHPQIHEEDSIVLTVTLKNTENMDGDEVIQVYSQKPVSHFEQPLKKLIAFKRVFIEKGAVKKVDIPVALKNLRIYDPSRQDYWLEPGEYLLRIGASSEDLRLTSKLTVIH